MSKEFEALVMRRQDLRKQAVRLQTDLENISARIQTVSEYGADEMTDEESTELHRARDKARHLREQLHDLNVLIEDVDGELMIARARLGGM